MPGVIGKYDLPDLVTAICPLRICILNPVSAVDQIVDASIFEQVYKDAVKKYSGSQNLMIGFNEDDVFLKLEKWLERE